MKFNFTRILISFKNHRIFKFCVNGDLFFGFSVFLDRPFRDMGPCLIVRRTNLSVRHFICVSLLLLLLLLSKFYITTLYYLFIYVFNKLIS